MNELESAVCARLHQFRERGKWPQAAFAYELGISRNKLASIEYGRTPLRYGLAKAASERFGLNLVWLAEAIGDPAEVIPFDTELKKSIPNGMLFTAAYQKFLKPRVSRFLRQAMKRIPGSGIKMEFLTPLGLSRDRHYEWQLWESLRSAFLKIPTEQHLDFCRAVVETMSRFAAGSKKHKNELTDISLKSKSAGMSEIQKLIKDVKNKASQPGAKSELAKTLGVAPARISEWLSGKKEPGGGYALQLADWVYGPRPKK